MSLYEKGEEEGEGDLRHRPREEGHIKTPVKMEGVTGIVLLQAKEQQGLPTC